MRHPKRMCAPADLLRSRRTLLEPRTALAYKRHPPNSGVPGISSTTSRLFKKPSGPSGLSSPRWIPYSSTVVVVVSDIAKPGAVAKEKPIHLRTSTQEAAEHVREKHNETIPAHS